MSHKQEKLTSVVLAGGVAKGAFESGALEVLSQEAIPISHIMAASSGALNGALYAAGIRAGREREAARRLTELWHSEGHWTRALDLSVEGAIHGRGVSTVSKLYQLVRSELARFDIPAVRPVELTLVLASLFGEEGEIAGKPATTYERVLSFDADDFATPEGRDRIALAVAASAAFPFLYEPVLIDELNGPFVDGGMVNNAPLKHAIDVGAERIIVIAPSAAVGKGETFIGGTGLVAQLVDILLGERLFRDLRETDHVNSVLARLKGLVDEGRLHHDQFNAVKNILGWKRHIDLVCIRPATDLPGNAFSGLFNRKLRDEYIEAGRQSAIAALRGSYTA
jgi:NTE family protein